MTRYRQLPLGNVLTLQRGFDITRATQREGQIPVVSSSGVNSFHDTAMVMGPGVVIGRKGTLGTAFYMEGPFWPHDTTLWVKDFKGNEPLFCYHLLKSLDLAKYDVGAANPTLNRNHLHLLDVPCPPVSAQRRIASILGAYDDLIEVNRRRIAVLEEMARRLFEEWFVHLRFPGSGSAAAMSIAPPPSWRQCTLADVFELVLGGTPSRARSEFWQDGSVPWISSSKANELRIALPSELITEEALRRSAAKMMPAGATVIAITGATLGQVSVLLSPMCGNQSLVGLWDPSGKRNEYGYRYIRHNIDSLINKASGGAQQHINKQIVERFPFLDPEPTVLDAYNRIALPVAEVIGNLIQANLRLGASRDLLLPRLISGDLAVTAAERELEAVA